MKKVTPLVRLGIVIVVGVIGGEFLFQYEHYRRFRYWEFFVASRDIPAMLGLIFVVILLIYFVKRNTKRE